MHLPDSLFRHAVFSRDLRQPRLLQIPSRLESEASISKHFCSGVARFLSASLSSFSSVERLVPKGGHGSGSCVGWTLLLWRIVTPRISGFCPGVAGALSITVAGAATSWRAPVAERGTDAVERSPFHIAG